MDAQVGGCWIDWTSSGRQQLAGGWVGFRGGLLGLLEAGVLCSRPAPATTPQQTDNPLNPLLLPGVGCLSPVLWPVLIAAAVAVQVVSQVADATGEVVLLPDLNGVQGVAFERPTVVLAQVSSCCCCCCC